MKKLTSYIFILFLSVGFISAQTTPPNQAVGASAQMKQQLMVLYGFDRPYYEQFLRWIVRAL